MAGPTTPTPNRRRAIVAALGVLFLLTAAAEWMTPRHAALIRNLCVLTGLAVVALQPAARARDLPLTRRRGVAPALAGLTAVAVAWPTLSLPYLADDWQLLEMRGRQDSFWASMTILPGEPWFRPVGWSLWWVFDKLSPLDATFAHAVNVGLFATAAMLVIPALRRCGVPRGLASAAAILFATHPAALDTVAWVTNGYSLLAVNGMLAALATLPFGRASWTRRIVPVGFALFAYLSKEDSYLFPVVVTVVAARFEPRRILTGLRAAWPFALAAAAVALTRHLLLDSGTPYQDPSTGESMWARRWLYGPRLALESELPAGYVLPVRGFPAARKLSYLWGLIPAALLVWGGASAMSKKMVRRAAPFLVMGLMPVAPLLPIGKDLETIRWLFFPSIGISLMTAALLANGPARGAFRWVAIALYGALALTAGRANFETWRESGAALTGGLDAAASSVKSIPQGGRAWILGIPWRIRGTYCANCGVPQLFQRTYDRRDVEFLNAEGATGILDVAEIVNTKGGVQVLVNQTDLTSPEVFDLGSNSLDGGRAWRTEFGTKRPVPNGVRFFDLFCQDTPTGRLLRAGLPGVMLLPVMRAPAGAKVKITLDGGPVKAVGDSRWARIHVTQLTSAGILRMPRPANRELLLAQGVEVFRVDLTIPFGEEFLLRSIEVRTAP